MEERKEMKNKSKEMIIERGEGESGASGDGFRFGLQCDSISNV